MIFGHRRLKILCIDKRRCRFDHGGDIGAVTGHGCQFLHKLGHRRFRLDTGKRINRLAIKKRIDRWH